MNTNIPSEINSILADSHTYEAIEQRVYNALLTQSSAIQGLRQRTTDTLTSEQHSISSLVNTLNIHDIDTLLALDPHTDAQALKQALKDIIVKELESILY
jgi:hypothetical protein